MTVRNSSTLSSFKRALQYEKHQCNVLFYYSERWASVHHARIRMGCSKLNYDLCTRLHVIDNPSCDCGYKAETASHFFFYCPLYNVQRQNMLREISIITNPTLNVLLHGKPNIDTESNQIIFSSVHIFIKESRLFT